MSGFTLQVKKQGSPIELRLGLRVPVVVQGGGGSGGERYEQVFGSVQLNVNGELIVFHGMSQNPSTVRVLDENREEIYPDFKRDFDSGSLKALIVGLKSFGVFSNFLIVLEV